MFGLNKKEELYLAGFTRLFMQMVIKSEGKRTLPNGSLTEKEEEKVKQELLYFRVVLLMYQLMAIRKFGNTEFSSEDVGKTLGLGFALALQDEGMTKHEAEKELEEVIKRLDTYGAFIEGVGDAELQKTGVYFNLIRCFSEIVLGKDAKRASTEEGRDKEFTVFDYGKQIYRSDEKALKEAMKGVRFKD